MKKSLAIACAALMLLTGCGSGGGSKVSEVPNEDIVLEQQNMDGIEWEESFVVVREDGERIGVSVDVVTTTIGEEAYSIYEFVDSYESEEMMRLLIPEGSVICSTEDSDAPKSLVFEKLSEFEEKLKQAQLEEDDQMISYCERRIEELNANLNIAPDDYVPIEEYKGDACYYVINNGSRVGIIDTIGPQAFPYADRTSESIIHIMFSTDTDTVYRSFPSDFSENQETAKSIVDNICKSLGMDEMELGEIEDWESEGGLKLARWVYPNIKNAFLVEHQAQTCLVKGEDGDEIYSMSVFPAQFTHIEERVSLLDFEEVKNAVKANFTQIKNLRLSDMNRIDKMELSITPIHYGDGGAYVPAWIINDGLLVLNAIDGSFICSINPNVY